MEEQLLLFSEKSKQAVNNMVEYEEFWYARTFWNVMQISPLPLSISAMSEIIINEVVQAMSFLKFNYFSFSYVF